MQYLVFKNSLSVEVANLMQVFYLGFLIMFFKSYKNEYLNTKGSVNNTKKSETKKTSKFSDILDMAKNIDTNKLQDSISSVQKAIGLIGDMLVKDKTPGTGSTYNPRPIYRRFDD